MNFDSINPATPFELSIVTENQPENPSLSEREQAVVKIAIERFKQTEEFQSLDYRVDRLIRLQDRSTLAIFGVACTLAIYIIFSLEKITST